MGGRAHLVFDWVSVLVLRERAHSYRVLGWSRIVCPGTEICGSWLDRDGGPTA